MGGYGVCRSCPPRWTLLAFLYGEARSQVPIRVGYKLYSNSSLELSLSCALGSPCPYGLHSSRTVIGVLDLGRSSSEPSLGWTRYSNIGYPRGITMSVAPEC